MAKRLREMFIKIGVTETNAALVRVVNGVICKDPNVVIGAIAERTIKQSASAPPNTPSLQINNTTGAIIIDIANKTKVRHRSPLRKNNNTATPPNPIHKMSLISRLRMSITVAMDSMENAKIIRIMFKLDMLSIIQHYLPFSIRYFCRIAIKTCMALNKKMYGSNN